MVFRVMSRYPMFLENSRGFRVYLRTRNLNQILTRTQLVRRAKNKILPHVRAQAGSSKCRLMVSA